MSTLATPQVITLQIDGQDVSARADESILDVARENGIDIPTMCHLDGLDPVGACRLCLIEIEGTPKLLPACMTYAEEGMRVLTDSPRLQKYRRTILELIFAERNHVCSVCVSNGHCELQNMAVKLGVSHVTVAYRYPKMEVDSSHDRFRLDHNRCILCTRCVRVCDAVEGAHTKDVMGRGVLSAIIHDLNEPWGDSDTCTSCGKCVHVCPTGALVEKGTASSEMAKRTQFLPYLTRMREHHS